MKRTLIVLLVIAALLCGCSAAPAVTEPPMTTQQSTTPVEKPVPDTTTVPSTDASETTAPIPTVPSLPEEELLFVNPLNGEKMAEPYSGRVVAVMLNNHIKAMPQFGNGQADVLFEVLAEGGITRCMGLYSDVGKVPKIGSVRSARKYFVDLALGYNSVYIHFGGSGEANNYIAETKIPDFNGMVAGAYVFQDKDRLNSGYASEHTWFVKGEKVVQFAADKGIDMTTGTGRDYGFRFDDNVISGAPANKLEVYFNMGGTPGKYTKHTDFAYNANEKAYFASQHGGEYVDANSGDTISFGNVMVLYAASRVQSDGKLLTVETVGSGTGLYASMGQVVPIRWSRENSQSPLTYTLEDGSELTFHPGSTYIGIVPTNATVKYFE